MYDTSRIGNTNNGGADGITRCLNNEFFADGHDFAVVAECLVELHHGELGVVAGADAFIAEHATNFVDAFHTANDESLEVKFKSDAQIQLHVERVVMSHERSCVCTTSFNVQHRCFNFNEIFGGQRTTET